MTRASIVVPTHDHARTLPLAVASALQPTVADVEVIIVGDGATAAVREAAEHLARGDSRVRFLDLDKGPHHGEIHRDAAVREAHGDAVFYLCDDDLLLPRHVENLLGLLAEADLVQCRNGWVDTSGQLRLHPTDLADPRAIDWHLAEPRRNATSLTGTAHTRTAYLALPEGWTTTPAGQWPDHFMWKKFFRQPGFRGATHPEMTAVQLPTSSGREDWDEQRRLAELIRWRDLLAAPDAHDWLQRQVVLATARQLDRTYRGEIDAVTSLAQLREGVAELEAQLATARLESAQQRADLELADRRLESVTTSRSWRVTRPLRQAARRVRGEG